MSARKKDLHGNTLPPQRTDEHRIDSEAVNVVRTRLTSDWMPRSLEDRDYGIDMMVEAFDGNSPTGVLILLQIKGCQASFGDGEISLSVPVRTLLYARMFQTPFFLVHASVTDQRAHFVWLQKYINTRLTSEHPRWNKQEYVIIKFPRDNVLNEAGLVKIRSLVNYVAHRDLGITFLGHLLGLSDHLEHFRSIKKRHYVTAAISRVKEIAKLEPFLEKYMAEIPDVYVDFDSMLSVLKKTEIYSEYGFDDESLIEGQLTNLHAIARIFLSQDEGDAFTVGNLDADFPY